MAMDSRCSSGMPRRPLAGAGLGDAQQITPRQQRRDGAGLDGGGDGVIFCRQSAQDRLGNAKPFKSHVSHKSP